MQLTILQALMTAWVYVWTAQVAGKKKSFLMKINFENKELFLLTSRFFTYYPELSMPMNESDCLLVGFNLRQACFNLNNVCVLLKECLLFNDTCSTCMVMS